MASHSKIPDESELMSVVRRPCIELHNEDDDGDEIEDDDDEIEVDDDDCDTVSPIRFIAVRRFDPTLPKPRIYGWWFPTESGEIEYCPVLDDEDTDAEPDFVEDTDQEDHVTSSSTALPTGQPNSKTIDLKLVVPDLPAPAQRTKKRTHDTATVAQNEQKLAGARTKELEFLKQALKNKEAELEIERERNSVKEGEFQTKIRKLENQLLDQQKLADEMRLKAEQCSSKESEQWRAVRKGYLSLKMGIQKERDAMEKLWKAREKQLEKVLLNATSIKDA